MARRKKVTIKTMCNDWNEFSFPTNEFYAITIQKMDYTHTLKKADNPLEEGYKLQVQHRHRTELRTMFNNLFQTAV